MAGDGSCWVQVGASRHIGWMGIDNCRGIFLLRMLPFIRVVQTLPVAAVAIFIAEFASGSSGDGGSDACPVKTSHPWMGHEPPARHSRLMAFQFEPEGLAVMMASTTCYMAPECARN